jgi:uncharacterized protein with PIN domain
MRKSRAEIKAELVAKYEAMLEEMLSQGETKAGLTLTDIEDMALRTRAEVGEQVTAALLETQAEQSIPGPRCPKCRQEMRYKGRKHRYLRTRSGEVEMERAYYYCPMCRQGHFPPG